MCQGTACAIKTRRRKAPGGERGRPSSPALGAPLRRFSPKSAVTRTAPALAGTKFSLLQLKPVARSLCDARPVRAAQQRPVPCPGPWPVPCPDPWPDPCPDPCARCRARSPCPSPLPLPRRRAPAAASQPSTAAPSQRRGAVGAAPAMAPPLLSLRSLRSAPRTPRRSLCRPAGGSRLLWPLRAPTLPLHAAPPSLRGSARPRPGPAGVAEGWPCPVPALGPPQPGVCPGRCDIPCPSWGFLCSETEQPLVLVGDSVEMPVGIPKKSKQTQSRSAS